MARADPGGGRRVVPMHDEVVVGTLAGLLRQAGLSKEELLRVL
jgi:predicted RNA binding protein YcfA (HicA-like mRNA interferase family)